MRLFQITPLTLLLLLVAGASQICAGQSLFAGGGESILYKPLEIKTLQHPDTAFKGVEPLNIESLFVAKHPQWKTPEELRLPALDKSVQFKGTQLIAPLTLVAVSSFGTWNRRAKDVNLSIQSGLERWRGDHRMHFDDYVQYLPAASYLALGFTGAKSRHNFKERLLVLGTSYIALGIMNNAVKYTVREPRPNNFDERNSYPSGHTATAFMGAELVRREYGTGYGIAAYIVACGVGAMRIYNNRHWLNDVMAGAGIGILSAQIGYWMLPYTRRLFGMGRSKPDFALAATPYYDYNTNAIGGGVAIIFN